MPDPWVIRHVSAAARRRGEGNVFDRKSGELVGRVFRVDSRTWCSVTPDLQRRHHSTRRYAVLSLYERCEESGGSDA